MQSKRRMWSEWAQFLHRWGLADLAVFLLEGGGPLAILAAQLIYLGQPVPGFAQPESHLQAAAKVMENRQELQEFIAFLREEKQP